MEFVVAVGNSNLYGKYANGMFVLMTLSQLCKMQLKGYMGNLMVQKLTP